MPELWFFVLVVCVVAYAVLDGFDVGAGIIHHAVARTAAGRRVVLASVGPVWDGNEVWLVAVGGVLFFAFPRLYAWSVSGFYLPVTFVLWLLVFRALGIELKHHGNHPLWSDLWDFVFSGASAALAFFFGVLVGNLVRGVDVKQDGFFVSLFTDFTTSGEVGVLDWFTCLWGALSVAVLALHGALWVGHRTRGDVATRAIALARRLIVPSAVLTVVVALASVWLQPVMARAVAEHPYLALAFALPLGALWRLRASLEGGAPKEAFFASVAFLASALGGVATLLAPYALVAPAGRGGVVIRDVVLDPPDLARGLFWFVPGLALVVGYFVFMYRSLPPTVGEEDVTAEH